MKLALAATVHPATESAQIGKHTLQIEIARTHDEQERGLMFRESLEADHGMLFVFPQPKVLNFWMKNTKIPLSIGYFSEKKILLKIMEMKAGIGLDDAVLPVYSSDKAAKYALEMDQKWFDKNEIRAGAQLIWPLVKKKN